MQVSVYQGEEITTHIVCILLGPDDTYLVQSDEDETKFWGWKDAQGYGRTFEWKDGYVDERMNGWMTDGWRQG